MSVWAKEDLDREQVRGLFAIAVLASIAVYLASRGSIGSSASPLASSVFDTLTTLSVILLMFWTLYVVTVAISMTFWSQRGILERLMRLFKAVSQWCFAMGSAMTVITAVYYFPFLVYLEYVSNPASFYPLVYFMAVALGAYAVLVVYLWQRDRRKKRETPPVSGKSTSVKATL